MVKKQTVTVVIATYNRALSLKKCLDSLVRQTDKNFDILIIDGGSTDTTIKFIHLYERTLTIRCIIDPTPQLSYIRDLGWRNAQGDIIASIDDDVIVSVEWIASIKKAFSDKRIGGVTGPTIIPHSLLKKRDVFIFYETKNKIMSYVANIYFYVFLNNEKFGIGKIYPSGAWSPGSNFPQSLHLKKPINVDYLEACNYAIPKMIIQEVGGYDLGYQGTSEWCEVDLSFRIRARGYRLMFDPAVHVEHYICRRGVYTRRFRSTERIYNFLRFYFCSYDKKTIDGFILFLLYFMCIATYYVSLSMSTIRNKPIRS